MFFKLVFKNIKKSIKDYTIYFLTMTFGVCLFYMFNSIDSQSSMMELTKSQYQAMKVLTQSISYVSVFVSIVLGFLIVYANQFLIKRRKKELGLYMTLGMDKRKISSMVVIETFLIGVFSLVVGLILGVFASQGLSVVTAKMFEVNLSKFAFIFSTDALYKTLLYFGIIFLIVIVFNAFSISRLKLINLITAGRKNEKLKIRNLSLSVFIFILSICCIGMAYRLIIENGMMTIDYKFTGSIVLGSIGTLLFFFSLSGFLLRVVQLNKKLYFKNMNMFILRQINSKINTTFVSMSVICIMLLITIGTLSSGMSLSNVLSQDLDKKTPYDASFLYYGFSDEEKRNEKLDIAEEISDNNIDISKYAKEYSQLTIYSPDKMYKDLNLDISLIPNSNKKTNDMPIFMISQSDYNNAMKIQGKPVIKLNDNQYAMTCMFKNSIPAFNKFLTENGIVNVNGKDLKAINNTVIEDCFSSDYNFENLGTMVVPDKYVNGLDIENQVLNLNFNEGIDQNEFVEKIDNIWKNGKEKPFYQFNTRSQIYEESAGLKTTISYIAIYIGFIFLITSAAVLALQQLSEASDNAQRYSLLRKLGAEEKMINHALFSQIAIYFFMPLLLVIIHSYVGISVVNNVVSEVGNINMVSNTFYTAVIFLIIYGGYFLATYLGSRSMIKPKRN